MAEESHRTDSLDRTSIHVHRAVQGEAESITWVVSRFQALVEAQVRLRLGGRGTAEDVEDLVAELWLVTLRRLPDLRPRDGRYAPVLVKFLGTTTLHLCNNFLRRKIRGAREIAAYPPEFESAADGSADQHVQNTRSVVSRAFLSEMRERIQGCLDRLSSTKRDVLVLRIMEQRSNKEIARILTLEPNTVAVRYCRALQDLRKCLPEGVFGEVWGSRA